MAKITCTLDQATFKVRLNGKKDATYRLTAAELEKVQQRCVPVEIVPHGTMIPRNGAFLCA